jgi:ankyrin repeat protein
MPLLDLANELLLSVAESLDKISDVNAFARTNQRTYLLLNRELYRIDVQRGGSFALLWAAENGQGGSARLSLTEGANCETTKRDHQKSISVHLRIIKNGESIIKFNFDDYHFFSRQDFTTLTPLQLAIYHKHDYVARLLIEHGADIRKRYPIWMAKCTTLHLASAHGLNATVQLLLNKGAKPGARDEAGQTPLHYAVKSNVCRPRCRGNVQTVLCLLEKGAKYDARDKSGGRPRDRVCEHLYGRWRGTEQEWEEDDWAKQRITQLLETREANQIVEKWDRDRESRRKKHLAAEKASQVRLADRNRERNINDRLSQEAQRRAQEELQKIAREKEAEWKRTEEERLKAQQMMKEEIQKTNSLRDRQEATRQCWSQLREQAENKMGTVKACDVKASLDCTHSSIGWLKYKAWVQCHLCGRKCAKYSFQCPDCGSVACIQCKQQLIG